MPHHLTQPGDRIRVPSLQNIDALPGESTLGKPNELLVKKWGWETAQFISSQNGDGTGQWRGVRPLGKGSFGIVGLWEKVNNNGEVVDRVVIKEENYTWGSRVPPEVETMKLLNNTGCESIVKLRGYKHYDFEGRGRTYMEFCPHRDLSDLIARYKLGKRYPPEPFIWHVFQSLAEAAYAMEYGPFADDTGQALDFEIVHRDIKPGNIFLGDEIREVSQGYPPFPYYPTPKLGDFGLAIKTHLYDENNPRKYHGAGSLAYRPPEQFSNSYRLWNPLFRHANNQLLAWTNVHAIGLVMFELCTLQRFTKTHSGYPDYEGDDLEPIVTGKEEEYSHDLRELIRECLQPATDMRPSTRKLVRLTQLGASKWHDTYDLEKYPVHPYPEERVYYQENEIEALGVREGSEEETEKPHDSHDSGFRSIPGSSSGLEDTSEVGDLREDTPEPEIDEEFFYRYAAAAKEFMKAEKRRRVIEEAKLKDVEVIEDDPDVEMDVIDAGDKEGCLSPSGDMNMKDAIYDEEWTGQEADEDGDSEMTDVSDYLDGEPEVESPWWLSPSDPDQWRGWSNFLPDARK